MIVEYFKELDETCRGREIVCYAGDKLTRRYCCGEVVDRFGRVVNREGIDIPCSSFWIMYPFDDTALGIVGRFPDLLIRVKNKSAKGGYEVYGIYFNPPESKKSYMVKCIKL